MTTLAGAGLTGIPRSALDLHGERDALKARALAARAASPGVKVIHLDQDAPERSGFILRRAGRPRCGANGHVRPDRLTDNEDLVTCLICVDAIPVDREELELGLNRYTYAILHQAATSSLPFGARWRALHALALRHPDEFAELEEAERVMGALAGRRRR